MRTLETNEINLMLLFFLLLRFPSIVSTQGIVFHLLRHDRFRFEEDRITSVKVDLISIHWIQLNRRNCQQTEDRWSDENKKKTIFFSIHLGQLCTLQFLPALQIINMAEDTQVGSLIARLQITGTASEISTRLVYNSSEVKTNGTDYFTLNFTNLYLRYCKFFRLNSKENSYEESFVFLSSSSRLWMVDGK